MYDVWDVATAEELLSKGNELAAAAYLAIKPASVPKLSATMEERRAHLREKYVRMRRIESAGGAENQDEAECPATQLSGGSLPPRWNDLGANISWTAPDLAVRTAPRDTPTLGGVLPHPNMKPPPPPPPQHKAPTTSPTPTRGPHPPNTQLRRWANPKLRAVRQTELAARRGSAKGGAPRGAASRRMESISSEAA